MMSMQSRLEQFYTGLAMVNSNCHHNYAPSNAKPPYIVWNEESEDAPFNADNHKVRQSISGFVEFITKTEFDSTFDAIQTFLDNFPGCSWTWDDSHYGDPTNDNDNSYHHTWSWRLR